MFLGIAVVLLSIVSVLGYRHYKLEAEITSMTWKVNWNDVLLSNSTSNKQRGSIYSLAKRGSQLVKYLKYILDLNSTQCVYVDLQTVYSEDMVSIPGDKQLYIPIAFYKGCKVAIKPILESNISLNRTQMLELKKVR